MSSFVHKLSISFYLIVIFIAFVGLSYYGRNYYNLPIEDRYYTATGEINQLHILLDPNGYIGHNLGIYGTVLIVTGLFLYSARKRFKMFSRVGVLKYWLEFHIFLTTLGSVMVLFHTAFKFGGLVSFGFWSLVVVWVSGVIGRFIYLQIPRTIEGRELSLQEVKDLKEALDLELLERYGINFSEIKTSKFSQIKLKLIARHISEKDFTKVKQLIRTERRITRRIGRLTAMQRLFRYWHVAHLPFALIMLIIMVIHVVVVLYYADILKLWIK